MQKQIFICDLCGKEINNYHNIRNKPFIDIAFDFNLVSGKPCKRYIEKKSIDMCDKCYEKFLKVFPIVSGESGKYMWNIGEK